ncbi:MAG: hypothetical protein QOH81_2295 [Sphingomonadales bacterium]|nr:hypothetical protein [Sphingomonadales bacterium]
MAIRLSVTMLPLLVALAGCGTREPGTFDLPAATVFARLTSGNMDDFRFARQCGLLIHFRTETEANRKVRWVVTSSGAEVASFAARLIPLDGGKTKVTIEIPRAPDGGEIYDGTKAYLRPALHQPLRPAIEELIAARVEQRAYDASRLPLPGASSPDGACDIQRGGLEAGIGHWRYDGNDGGGLGNRDSSSDQSSHFGGSTTYTPPDAMPASAKPMTDAKPMIDAAQPTTDAQPMTDARPTADAGSSQ